MKDNKQIINVSSDLNKLYDNYYYKGNNRKRYLSSKDSVREIRKITSGQNLSTILDIGGEGAVLQEMDNCKIAKSITAIETSQSN